MTYSIAAWIHSNDEEQRRKAFVNVLRQVTDRVTPEYPCCAEAGTFRDFVDGSPQKRSVSLATLLDAVTRLLGDYSQATYVFRTEAAWDIWIPTYNARLEYTGSLARSQSDVNVTYYGSAASSPIHRAFKRKRTTFVPAEQMGDIRIDVSEVDVLRDLQLDRKHDARQENRHRDNCARFDSLLRSVLEALPGADVIVGHTLSIGEGATVAPRVFHPVPREFLRDLVRGLFLMHSHLVGFATLAKTGLLGRNSPAVDLWYGDPSFAEPENLCDSREMGRLRDECLQACDTLGSYDASYLLAQVVQLPLLNLCRQPALLADAICHAPPQRICDVIQMSDVAILEEIAGGYLVEHIDLEGDRFTTVYHDLARAVLEGAFAR